MTGSSRRMYAKPKGCEGCPAYKVGQSYVPGEGPPTPRVVLIGQGPGRYEAYSGRPFVGPSGSRLDSWLALAGLSRSELWVDNIIRCWVTSGGKDRAPLQAEAKHCWEAHLREVLEAPGVEYVVPIGVPAMTTILGRSGSDRMAGSVIRMKEVGFAP